MRCTSYGAEKEGSSEDHYLRGQRVRQGEGFVVARMLMLDFNTFYCSYVIRTLMRTCIATCDAFCAHVWVAD